MIAAMAKHLPPSASRLRLLDVNGEAGAVLVALRPDLEVIAVPGYAAEWQQPPESADAVVAVNYILNARFLAAALAVLRPGGRLIVVDSHRAVGAALGETLSGQGYVRILVEAAVAQFVPGGVLMRGEKPHTTEYTLRRIQAVAGMDADMLAMGQYKGRYVHLLIRETPNLPPWRRDGSEVITWRAAAVQADDMTGGAVLLAFSSLPKAVGFMQPAVLAGRIVDVNKVAKFSRETAGAWAQPVLLNPALTALDGQRVIFIPVDRATTEAPDE